jgi:glycosyltransferase involved in cell wall biosynthesis
LNILLLNTYANFGGAARACYRLHQGFRREGHASTLLARNHLGPALEGVEIYDNCRQSKKAQQDSLLVKLRSEALVAPESTYFSPPAPRSRLAQSFFLRDADAVNIHWVADYLSPRDLRDLFSCRKPVVWTLHDARVFTGGCHYPGDCHGFQHNCSACPQLRQSFRALAEVGLEVQRSLFEGIKTPVFVTPSDWLRRLTASSPFLADARIEVIPYGLDLSIFRPRSEDCPKSQMGWKKDAFVVLFGAHSLRDKRKGVDVVLDAIEQCLNQRDIKEMVEKRQLVFACFGEAENFESKDNLPIRMLGSFTGDESAARIYQACDVFICASREDNLPNTVMEAMACGLAVIGTKAGGIPEMIDDENTGRLIPIGDAASLATALLHLIRNKRKARAMGALASKKCEDLYSYKRQVTAYKHLFEQLQLPDHTECSVLKDSDRQSRKAELKATSLIKKLLPLSQGALPQEPTGNAKWGSGSGESTFVRFAILARRILDKIVTVIPYKAIVHKTTQAVVVKGHVSGDSELVIAGEINNQHGTGVLLERIFRNSKNLVHVRSFDAFGGKTMGKLAIYAPEGSRLGKTLKSELARARIERIMAVPYFAADVENATVAKKTTKAPLCVWIMDSHLGSKQGEIPVSRMKELLTLADLRLAISPYLKNRYEELFGLAFHFVPPVVDAEDACLQPLMPPGHCEGVLFGNIWSQSWADKLAELLSGARVSLAAYGNTSPAWIDTSHLTEMLRSYGFLPEEELVRKLRTYSYAIVPSGALDGSTELTGVARYSLPSRLIFLAAKANLPVVVLGHEGTGAARFVLANGLGCVCPYEEGPFRTAIQKVCQSSEQISIRTNAARVANVVAMEGMDKWIWESLALRRPVDDRFDKLAY